MKLTHEDHGQLTVMTLRGELAGDQADMLKKEAVQRVDHQIRDFVLDISAMEFVDSKGLETLLWLQDRAGEHLGQVRLACPAENVQKILEITRISARFDCHGDVESAIKSL